VTSACVATGVCGPEPSHAHRMIAGVAQGGAARLQPHAQPVRPHPTGILANMRPVTVEMA